MYVTYDDCRYHIHDIYDTNLCGDDGEYHVHIFHGGYGYHNIYDTNISGEDGEYHIYTNDIHNDGGGYL